MAIPDVTPVENFKSRPHGTQVKDASAPQGDATEALAGVFIGYPDCVTVEAAEASVVWGSNDFVITDGVPTLDNPQWLQLGTVGSTTYLRLDRVRYGFIKVTTLPDAVTGAAFVLHQGELNVIEDTPATIGIDG